MDAMVVATSPARRFAIAAYFIFYFSKLAALPSEGALQKIDLKNPISKVG